MRPLFSRGKWICRFRQAGEKRSRSSIRAFLSRLASASQLSGEERRPRLIAHAFRRNGHPVPAQRHHRSGETASPFRRNGTPVPARLAPRLGRSRRVKRGGRPPGPRFSTAICLFYDGFLLKTQTNGHFHACNHSVLVPMRIFSHRHENVFSWARESRLFVTPRGRTRTGGLRLHGQSRHPVPPRTNVLLVAARSLSHRREKGVPLRRLRF